MKRYCLSFLMIVFLLSVSTTIYAKVALPHCFSDNMVLQRELPIHIWGTADKNESITISFNGTTATTIADKKGNWTLNLPQLPAGGPYRMEIKGSNNTILFENILLGDVWICSGQSNMEMELKNTYDANEVIKSAANSNIRLLTVPKTVKQLPESDIEPTKWVACEPSTVPGFSAVGYFFGLSLQRSLNIPIGLIHTSWGGTNIQTWTSWATMLETDEYKASDVDYGKAAVKATQQVESYNRGLVSDIGLQKRWYEDKTNCSDWKTTSVPQSWSNEFGRIDGVMWCKKELTLSAAQASSPATLHLGKIDDREISYVNGQKVGETNSWDARRNYTIPSGILREGKNTITVRIVDNSGIGGFTDNADQVYLQLGAERMSLAGEWLSEITVSNEGLRGGGSGPNVFPSLLYNGMIHPLIGYGIKGAIWYQGEANESEAFAYRTLFPNMIRDWRKLWGYEFPFFWAQLASFKAVNSQPQESMWAELREAQNMTLSLPATGQAVITDIGDAGDIHPRNKRDVGLRLAQNALKTAYGEDILGSGPAYSSMQIKDGRAILTFTNQGKELSAKGNRNGYVNGFTIAGADKKFVRAIAFIKDNTVVVFSDQVATPVAVRYGWADNPYDNNLVNSDGHLCSPFRTDSWKGITEK